MLTAVAGLPLLMVIKFICQNIFPGNFHSRRMIATMKTNLFVTFFVLSFITSVFTFYIQSQNVKRRTGVLLTRTPVFDKMDI